jgi:hypothetical protein
LNPKQEGGGYMIVHITRELGLVVVYGANGNEDAVREIFERQEIEDKVRCNLKVDGYLCHKRLSIYLRGVLLAVLPDEDIKVYAY